MLEGVCECVFACSVYSYRWRAYVVLFCVFSRLCATVTVPFRCGGVTFVSVTHEACHFLSIYCAWNVLLCLLSAERESRFFVIIQVELNLYFNLYGQYRLILLQKNSEILQLMCDRMAHVNNSWFTRSLLCILSWLCFCCYKVRLWIRPIALNEMLVRARARAFRPGANRLQILQWEYE